MASVLKIPFFHTVPRLTLNPSSSCLKPSFVSFLHNSSSCFARQPRAVNGLRLSRPLKFVALSSNGEATENEVAEEPTIEDNLDNVEVEEDAGEEAANESDNNIGVEEVLSSAVLSSLKSYREALTSNDESRIAEIESFINSIEDEKSDLEKKVASLSQELSVERERVLRISADFDNFRKRTERERLSLMTNAQGEVIESLLPVLDNFERAKSQIKVENEGEEKISNNYQSIYKQFSEILTSLGVVPVETTGSAFDPLGNSRVGSKFGRVLDELFLVLNRLHEAIMREDSDKYEEGIILEEFRKGFQIGDRLLRPSMVKVSAGPGPAKPAETDKPSEETENVSNETVLEEVGTEQESA